MNIIHKKLLLQKIHSYEYPNNEKFSQAKKLLEGWQKALKDSDLERTKEKSVQGKFLSTFFEDILGYSDVTTGHEEWTLIQHPRIENDSKEPDGSLGWFSKDEKHTRAVIELKDAKTLLDKKQYRGSEKLTPIEQAYLYATKYDGCNWIIVSNFKEIRLYNKHKTQEYYEKFDVMSLTDETEFKRFYYLLSKDTLISKDTESVIDVLTKNTIEGEQDITKKFYIEYKQVRLSLLKHLREYNPNIEKVMLLEKAQKILDRLIFTLFCEDTSNLLPLNIVKTTYERALNSLSPSDERVWAELKGLYTAIDKGNSRVKPPINAYNGGLFAHDEVLDGLSIKDDFWSHLMKLADYDFETDLNVNILGHIFEQSISDLESLKSELQGEAQEEKKSKRKKDGIFYTPEYITKYIVENSVGKYLEEHPDRLESIKILDPACGSGSILNQAHSFLVNEYKTRHEEMILKKLEKNESITLFDYNPAETNKEILLNNLYGVDINQESVEISKLALWLKTARRTEPLQNLDKNIKCRNSLIDDTSVVGEKALNWDSEYKDIMDNGGFDVIVGNPPYVQLSKTNIGENEKNYLLTRFNTSSGRLNTYGFFILLGISLLREGGYLSYIIPNTLLTQEYYEYIREFIVNNSQIIEIVNYDDLVFPDAVVENITLILKKKKKPELELPIKISHQDTNIYKLIKTIKQSVFSKNYKFNFDIKGDSVSERIYRNENNKKLGEIANINQAIALKGDKNKSIFKVKESGDNFYKLLDGRNISKYHLIWTGEWLKYDVSQIHSCKSKDIFIAPEKLLFRRVSSNLIFTYDNSQFFALNTLVVVTLKDKGFNLKYLLAVLNSKTVNYFYVQKFKSTKTVFSEIQARSVAQIPVPKASQVMQQLLADKAQKILSLNTELHENTQKALELLVSKYSPKTLSSALKTFYMLGWNELIDELEKQNVKVSLSNQEELQQWFDRKRSELSALANSIKTLNEEIDQEVYKLYSLTEEEISLIELSTTK